jgi:hypothetical protein
MRTLGLDRAVDRTLREAAKGGAKRLVAVSFSLECQPTSAERDDPGATQSCKHRAAAKLTLGPSHISCWS